MPPTSQERTAQEQRQIDNGHKKFNLNPVLLSTTLPLYLGLKIRPTAVEPILLTDLIPRCILLTTKLVVG